MLDANFCIESSTTCASSLTSLGRREDSKIFVGAVQVNSHGGELQAFMRTVMRLTYTRRKQVVRTTKTGECVLL